MASSLSKDKIGDYKTMKMAYLAFVMTFALALFPTASNAADIEVKSKNITFVGNVSEGNGVRLVKNLEIYRSTILAIIGLENKPDPAPLKVYGVKTTRELGKFIGGRGPSGLYKQGLDGPIFLTITKGGFKGDNWTSQVALHEYGHHILHGLAIDSYPRWYDEGFANYLSTFKVEGNLITVGAPTLLQATSLRDDIWMQPETVLGSITQYPRRGWINQFYAQSWLYVHYMQNTSEIGSKLPVYLNKLKAGQKALPAFESAFGVSPNQFHELAKQYWRDNAFPVMQFKAKAELLSPEITVRTLTKDEALLAYSNGERNFLSKKKARKLEKSYAKLVAVFGPTVEILEGQSHVAMTLEDFEAARGFANLIVEKNPSKIEGLRMQGDIGYHKLNNELFKDATNSAIRFYPESAELKMVIKSFEKALAVDPMDYTSNTHLVSLYGRSNLPVSFAGKKAADIMTRFYLKSNSVGGYLDVANVYMRSGKTAQACEYYGIARAKVDGYDNKKVNDDFARAEVFSSFYADMCQAG